MKVSAIFSNLLFATLLVGCQGGSSDGSVGGGAGQSSSKSTFAIANNQLYVMDQANVGVFDLNNGRDIAKIQTLSLGRRDGETLFNHQGSHLLVGKQSGVDILEINNQGKIKHIAEHSHLTACDPVITQGERAFITISSGERCRTGVNRLEVLDISNMKSPRLIYQKNMASPQGLAISGNNLFICDTKQGLQRFTIIDNGEGFDLEAGYISDYFTCDDIIINQDTLVLKSSREIKQVRWQGDDFTLLSTIEAQ